MGSLKHLLQVRHRPPSDPRTTEGAGGEETSEEDLLSRTAEVPPLSQSNIAATQSKQLKATAEPFSLRLSRVEAGWIDTERLLWENERDWLETNQLITAGA